MTSRARRGSRSRSSTRRSTTAPWRSRIVKPRRAGPRGEPVAPAPPATGVKRWWPDVVDNKFVQVVYYESQEKQATADPSDTECSISIGSGFRRVEPNSSLVDTYRTYSRDGGNTWVAPIRVSNVTTNWCNVVSNICPNMGDNKDTEAREGHRAGTVWADGRPLRSGRLLRRRQGEVASQ